jgi:hypothetical protein
MESTMDQPTEPVRAYGSVTAAALDLGHRSYSGTVAAAQRCPDDDASD